MTVTVAPGTSTAAPGRFDGLDRLRGLAILVMVADHLTLVFGGPDLLRVTLGRLAMPLFFLVAGSLVSRPSWRWAGIYLVGCFLPVVVPWVDQPNVLVLYVAGAGLLWLARWAELPSWVLVAVSLTVLANGWTMPVPLGYQPSAVIALMALGSACLPRATAGSQLPSWLALPGRHPLSLYVGHVLVLQGFVLAGVSSLPAGG